jgi:hypothetical protein
MRRGLQVIGVLTLGLMVGLGSICPAAAAQEATAEGAQAESAESIAQIRLTEAQVKGYIAAQPDMTAILPKLDRAGDQESPELESELDGIAKKHGFKDFEELSDVATNVSIVMAGFDSETGEFVEPVEALKKELEEIKKDSSIPADQRKELEQELTELVKITPVLEHRENIDLIKAYRQEIEKALE